MTVGIILKHLKNDKHVKNYNNVIKMFCGYRRKLSREEVAWTCLPVLHTSKIKEEYASYIKQSDTEN